MPSLLHEGLLALVRERPEFAVELVRDLFGIDVPPHQVARIGEASLNEVVPVEYACDLFVLLDAERPVYGITLETQLQRDERKRLPGMLGISRACSPQGHRKGAEDDSS
jgi:hypothetical protein